MLLGFYPRISHTHPAPKKSNNLVRGLLFKNYIQNFSGFYPCVIVCLFPTFQFCNKKTFVLFSTFCPSKFIFTLSIVNFILSMCLYCVGITTKNLYYISPCNAKNTFSNAWSIKNPGKHQYLTIWFSVTYKKYVNFFLNFSFFLLLFKNK